MPILYYHTIFFTFLKLGCLSFGGPAAHLVFFHQTCVKQLNWLDDAEYAQLVALAQILPGPTSSQVGLAIGYVKKGYYGAVLAWLGFTLPSALLMTLIAVLGQSFFPFISSAFFHNIQLVVLAVVIWAFWQMLRSFCTQLWQYILMLSCTLLLYILDLAINQILIIFIAALVGIGFNRFSPLVQREKSVDQAFISQVSLTQKMNAFFWLLLFILPFCLFQFFATFQAVTFFESFYRTASLVFGGGHIILPFLHQDFVTSNLVSAEKFDLGYAFAQLMPGPLFSFASYIGALIPITDYPVLNAGIATISIFLPSFFLIFATLPYWSWWMNQTDIRHAVIGINAGVVSLLLYLLIEMATDSIIHFTDFIFVTVVVGLLKTQLPVWLSLVGSVFVYQIIFFLLT